MIDRGKPGNVYTLPTMEVPPPNHASVYRVYKMSIVNDDQSTDLDPALKERHFQQQLVQPLSSPQQSEKSTNTVDQDFNKHIEYSTDVETTKPFKPGRKLKKKYLDEDELTAKINNLKLDTEKSPVAKLNEFQNFSKKVIDFELISVTGHVHSPVFTLSAKCDSIIVHGQGSSKKEAKNNAAIAFLNQIDINNSQNIITSTTSNGSCTLSNMNQSTKALETITDLNPIGVLQELCMARHWELPSYEIEDFNGPQKPWYSIKCTLKIYIAKGEGKTKQMAKRNAAHHMYDTIKNLSAEEISALNTWKSKSKIKLNNNILNKDDFGEQLITNFNDNTLRCIRVFFEELKSSKNPSISLLKDVQLNLLQNKPIFNSIEFLDNIGKEEGFNITYVLISTNPSDVEVLVQLVIIPLMVNVGRGKTFDEAQEAAAYTSLVYLKLLLVG